MSIEKNVLMDSSDVQSKLGHVANFEIEELVNPSNDQFICLTKQVFFFFLLK